MPVLAHPLALLGLAALPALLAIYFLYSRFRRREVSALFLWLRLGRQTAGRSRLLAGLPPRCFWVELLILLALALAAAGLCWPAPRRLRPLVVVLDDSLSMQASSAGSTARQRALALLRAELRRLQPTSVRLVMAGRTPQIGPRLPPAESLQALDTWHCRAASADLPAALSAARTHDPDARLLVLSDHPPAEPVADPHTRWLSSGRPAANAGIVNAVRSALTPTADRVLVDARAFGEFGTPPTLVLRAAGHELHRQSLATAAGDTAVVLTVPASAAPLEIELSADALAADNRAQLPPAWRPRLRTELRVRDATLAKALERAIAAAELPAATAADVGLRITDDDDAPTAPNGDWLVRFHLAAADSAVHPGPFALDRNHPLCTGLDLEGVVWRAGAAPGDGLPVLLAGPVPLIREREFVGGSRSLDIALEPAASTLLQSPAWPVLLWNLLHWRAQAAPGFGTAQARCGQWLQLTSSPAGEASRLHLPDGTAVTLRPPPGGRTTGVIAEEPGLYRAENAAGVFELACLPGVPDESDLRACTTATAGAWAGTLDQGQGYWSSATACGLLAAAALAAHGWLLYRRRRPGHL